MRTLEELAFKKISEKTKAYPAGLLEKAIWGEKVRFVVDWQFLLEDVWILVKVFPKSRFYKQNLNQTIVVLDRFWDCCELFSRGGICFVAEEDVENAQRAIKRVSTKGVHKVPCLLVATTKNFWKVCDEVKQIVKQAIHDAVVRSEHSSSELAD